MHANCFLGLYSRGGTNERHRPVTYDGHQSQMLIHPATRRQANSDSNRGSFTASQHWTVCMTSGLAIGKMGRWRTFSCSVVGSAGPEMRLAGSGASPAAAWAPRSHSAAPAGTTSPEGSRCSATSGSGAVPEWAVAGCDTLACSLTGRGAAGLPAWPFSVGAGGCTSWVAAAWARAGGALLWSFPGLLAEEPAPECKLSLACEMPAYSGLQERWILISTLRFEPAGRAPRVFAHLQVLGPARDW